MKSNEVLLAEVPRHEYAQANVQPGQKWRLEFNAACWLRVRSSDAVLVSLMLRWRDGGGERQLQVDQAGCGGKESMLLNGLVSVSATGRIEEMSAWVVTDGRCDLFVDELLVQRKLPPQPAQSPRPLQMPNPAAAATPVPNRMTAR
jgi:hypothetical protein